ncbi:GvpL/GvpF family gas vesicle protein [Actinomadura verrucosospora]|uniref:Gas vesicle synthesis protein GvpL/GvpF n=1 Tax=Actinomadura verrucosospora TaxID=46165 RepID=A0A7D3VPL4_ACTVE|nr:GvpL/GvpF family gas vesicle protein [Actinomadura verrucosospora]QKG19053.1 Gas vesicle synthesis protein GvpL/GvpF [Actinomadura verrucosospora]
MTEHRTAGDALAVYLYGVARGLDPAALDGAAGVGGAPVRTVPAGALTALVSTVRLEEYGEAALRENLEDLAWLEAAARAHHEVVDRAAHAAPTAPVRIATIYRDDARVAQVLAEQGDRFGQALDRVAGRAEWGVKAYAHREALEPAEPAQAAEPAGAGPGAGAGTAYLRRRQDERRRRADAGRRVSERAREIHDRLAGLAVASRHHPPQDPKLSGRDGVQILNVAYLLEDGDAPAFADAARAAGERYAGIEVEVTGPWPPYSFIDTADVGTAEPAATEPAATEPAGPAAEGAVR